MLWWPRVDRDTPTLAWPIIDLAEQYLKVPTGLGAGQPLRLTDEQLEVLVAWYQVEPSGRRYVYRRMLMQMAKGWAKSPLGAIDAFANLCGDIVPDGLDAAGQPVGRPHPSPWYQVGATSEDQTDNLYLQLTEMLRDSPAVDDLRLDVGVTRTQFRDRAGFIEPVTSSAGAREGQPISGAALEEVQNWYRSNGGTALAAVFRRNATKMGARTIELCNAPRPGEGSVAEKSREAILSGRVAGALFVCREAPALDSLDDREALRGALRVAYGGAAKERGGWIDLDDVVSESSDGDPAEFRRFYLNQIVAPEEALIDLTVWAELVNADARLVEGDVITLGFDGSDTGMATALYACRWPDWLVVPIGVWEAPDGAKNWRVDRAEVDAVVRDACSRFKVVRGYFDDPLWQSEIDAWSGDFGDSVMRFPHRSDYRIGPASERFVSMVQERTLRHTGDPILTRHLANGRRAKCPRGDWWRPAPRVIGRPVDAASAAISAVHAMGDAVARGDVTTQQAQAWGAWG